MCFEWKRYQHTVTAYFSLLMYLGIISYQEILCEHHEDILGKLNDKEFHGIQVKTKDLSLGLLKFNDEAIESSIIRFIELDLQFEIETANEAGNPIPEGERTAKMWYVFFAEEGGNTAYTLYLSENYFSKNDIIALARSVHFNEGAFELNRNI